MDFVPPIDAVVLSGQALGGDDPTLRVMALALDFVTTYVPAFVASYLIVGARGLDPTGPAVVRTAGPDAPDGVGLYASYLGTYARIDPFFDALRFRPDARLLTIDDAGGEERFRASRFAREFLAAIGAGPRLWLLLRDHDTMFGRISLTRRTSEGEFSAGELAFLEDSHAFLESAHRAGIGRTTPGPIVARVAGAHGLTPRERDVLQLAVSGLEVGGIAAELGIAPATVAGHVRRICSKLGIEPTSRASVLVRHASGQ